MLDMTTHHSLLSTQLRLDPESFKRDAADLLGFICQARNGVAHNVTLLHKVKRWPDGADKNRNLRDLRDNINAWRSKARNAVLAYRARRENMIRAAYTENKLPQVPA